MIGRLRPRDPFWDDGTGARRTHRRLRVEGLLALAIAIVACGVTAACGSAPLRRWPTASASADEPADGPRLRPERCERSPPVSPPSPPPLTRGGCSEVPGQDGLLDNGFAGPNDGDEPSPRLTCPVASIPSRDALRWQCSRSPRSTVLCWRQAAGACGRRAPRRASTSTSGRPRPRLAERQPQRQQHALSRRRDRPVPPGGRRPEGRRPLDPDPIRLHRRGPQGVRLPGPLHGLGLASDLRKEWRRDLLDVSVAAGSHLVRLPVRRLHDRRPVRPRCRGVFRGVATADDLGRLRSRRSPARSMPGRRPATARRSSPSASDRPGRRCSSPGAATSPSRGSGTWRPVAARRRRRGLGRAVAHADPPARRLGQSQPGPQHPAERHRRRAAAARPRAADPDAAADAATPRRGRPAATGAQADAPAGAPGRTATEGRSRRRPPTSTSTPTPAVGTGDVATRHRLDRC